LDLVQFLLDHSPFSGPANDENPPLPLQMGASVHPHPLSKPLEVAIWCNKLEAAQLLVDRGANVNDRAFTFLHCFAQEGLHEGLCLLLRAGANVNLVDSDSGETPLWAAASNGHVQVVKELIKARADIHIRDKENGETPLGVAYRKGRKRIVYLLLRTSPHVWPRLPCRRSKT
jgi:ankyrin repeat protein